MRYIDRYPDLTIGECLNHLEQDINMLRDGSWEPDDDSCDASLDMIESICAKLKDEGIDV